MTIDEYIERIQDMVSPELREETKDWSSQDRLYVYLHTIQLSFMQQYMEMLDER